MLVTLLLRSAWTKGLVKLYRRGFWLMIGAGSLFVAALLFFPPEEFDQAGNLIGEMPKAFGPSLALIVFGGTGLVLSWLGSLLCFLWRRFDPQSAPRPVSPAGNPQRRADRRP